MILRPALLLIIQAALLSCHSEHNDNNLVLKIILTKNKTEHLAGRYLYLFNNEKRKIIDSTLVRGDTVIFTEPLVADFIPYEASVRRSDTFQGHPYYRPVGILNPYIPNYIYSSFYIDKGITILKPYMTGIDTTQSGFAGSRQNEPFFRKVELQYVEKGVVGREAVIKDNISKIKAYPHSIYLLKQLYNYKEKFSDHDLKSQLAYFDPDVKKTEKFKRFYEYFTSSATFDLTFPSIALENHLGQYQKPGRTDASYYLIVYWASWCGPCRREIHYLKELQDNFADRGLSITGISIDENRDKWQTALQQEKMHWQQLIAIDSTRTFINNNYDIKAIPKAYLYDRKKELIETFGDALTMTRQITALFEHPK